MDKGTVSFITYFKKLLEYGYNLSFLYEANKYILYIRNKDGSYQEKFSCSNIFKLENQMKDILENEEGEF